MKWINLQAKTGNLTGPTTFLADNCFLLLLAEYMYIYMCSKVKVKKSRKASCSSQMIKLKQAIYYGKQKQKVKKSSKTFLKVLCSKRLAPPFETKQAIDNSN